MNKRLSWFKLKRHWYYTLSIYPFDIIESTMSNPPDDFIGPYRTFEECKQSLIRDLNKQMGRLKDIKNKAVKAKAPKKEPRTPPTNKRR